MELLHHDSIPVEVHDTATAVGEAAAARLAAILRDEIAQRGSVAVILASAASQETFMAALPRQKGVDWSCVTVFHMDEYLGLSDSHAASFRYFIRRRVVDVLHPRAFHGIAGDASDPTA